MKEQHYTKPIVVGFFIFVGLVILLIGIFAIGNQKKAFVKSFTVNAIFDDVQGLQPGNNVWLSGMKVGTVKKVAFYKGSQVEIILNIEKDARQHIRKDAMARISTDGLVGNKIVVIYGGTANSAIIDNNDQLQTEHHSGTEEMLATLQASNTNLLEITNNLKTVSRQLTTTRGTLGQLINDPSIGNELKTSVGSLRAAAAGSQKVVTNLQDFTTNLSKPDGLANKLITDTTIFPHLQATMNKFNDAATAAYDFTEKIKTAGDALNDPNTPLGTLLHDEDAAADLQRTIKNLRVSSQELSDDLEAVQHNFLLRGFFKKKKKE